MTAAPLRAGSLCSGYGGLEMGAELVLGPLQLLLAEPAQPAHVQLDLLAAPALAGGAR